MQRNVWGQEGWCQDTIYRIGAKPIVDHDGRVAIAELCRKRIDDHHYLNKISARIPPV